MKRWDIFCRIVDNFGDIGVCWRLARQLNTEHGIDIRLWIDDLNIARQLIPTLDVSQRTQQIGSITVAAWDESTRFQQATDAVDAVIETFGCELPQQYLSLMQPETVWINLEYLSAEAWVEGFHAQHSKRGNLTRHFFFPGFTQGTGGLLREHDIIKKNQNIAAGIGLQTSFSQGLNLSPDQDSASLAASLKISLFCYPHAAISHLLAAMASSDMKIICYVPATGILPNIAEFFTKDTVTAGDHLVINNLSLHVLPFLSQSDYDRLLASCDINFVRGEDSWIRAIWAGKPFVWQPYLQAEETHITKLNAFLDLFYSGCETNVRQAADSMHRHWASGQMTTPIWKNYLSHIVALRAFTEQKTLALAAQTDLATNLVIYIEKLHHNHI